MRVLPAALGRHVGYGAFQNLQERLLHALARHIAGNRRVFVLLGDLVNLVDIYDALLGLLDVSIGGLQQLQNDVFHVFADIAGFRERGGIDDCERHFKHARQRLRQQRLARARGTNQKNVGLRQFHVAGLAVQENSLVVVVDRDGEFLLGVVLPDDVAIQKSLNLGRPRQAGDSRA